MAQDTAPAAKPAERKKRTIQEIRDSKKSGEKMVYMSVPDYTAAKWAEAAGVDVAVVGDSLAMIAHGHPNTIPATMDMMAMHAAATRRGAPNTAVPGETTRSLKLPATAQHRARSAAGSSTRIPPATLTQTAWLERETPAFFSRMAPTRITRCHPTPHRRGPDHARNDSNPASRPPTGESGASSPHWA